MLQPVPQLFGCLLKAGSNPDICCSSLGGDQTRATWGQLCPCPAWWHWREAGAAVCQRNSPLSPRDSQWGLLKQSPQHPAQHISAANVPIAGPDAASDVRGAVRCPDGSAGETRGQRRISSPGRAQELGSGALPLRVQGPGTGGCMHKRHLSEAAPGLVPLCPRGHAASEEDKWQPKLLPVKILFAWRATGAPQTAWANSP